MTSNEVSNLSLVLSSAIAIAAIVSPIVVSVIDNLFSQNKFKIEVLRKNEYDNLMHINSIYEDYLISLATLSSYASAEFYTAELKQMYRKSYYLLMNVVDESISKHMIQLDEYVESNNWKLINDAIVELIPLIRRSLLNKNK